jgi:hypothetical protein
MSQPGLMQISPDLVKMLRAASVEERRRVVERVCRLAIERTGVSDEVAIDAVNGLRRVKDIDVSVRAKISALTQRLDEVAWDIQEKVENSAAAEDEYLRAFMKARATAAVAFALDDSLSATFDALYEAYYAIGDREEFVRTVATETHER